MGHRNSKMVNFPECFLHSSLCALPNKFDDLLTITDQRVPFLGLQSVIWHSGFELIMAQEVVINLHLAVLLPKTDLSAANRVCSPLALILNYVYDLAFDRDDHLVWVLTPFPIAVSHQFTVLE